MPAVEFTVLVEDYLRQTLERGNPYVPVQLEINSGMGFRNHTIDDDIHVST